MGRVTLLMLSDSERNANMLYAVGVFVPDPFIYLRINNKSLIVLNDMEIDRARKLARHCKAEFLRVNLVDYSCLLHHIRIVCESVRAGEAARAAGQFSCLKTANGNIDHVDS